jgi:hypothetical protein
MNVVTSMPSRSIARPGTGSVTTSFMRVSRGSRAVTRFCASAARPLLASVSATCLSSAHALAIRPCFS